MLEIINWKVLQDIVVAKTTLKRYSHTSTFHIYVHSFHIIYFVTYILDNIMSHVRFVISFKYLYILVYLLLFQKLYIVFSYYLWSISCHLSFVVWPITCRVVLLSLNQLYCHCQFIVNLLCCFWLFIGIVLSFDFFFSIMYHSIEMVSDWLLCISLLLLL